MIITAITAAVVYSSNQSVCYALDLSPNESTITSWILGQANADFSNGKIIGERLAAQIKTQCPEYIPLALLWAKHNS